VKILRIPLVVVLVVVAGRTFDANAQTETALYSFGRSLNDGEFPFAGLVQGSDGNFYGTSYDGGVNDYGTVFRISPSGGYTTLYSFAGPPSDGANPHAGLAQGSDGNFYGTTLTGGTSTDCPAGCGTVFRIGPSGAYTILYSFAGSPTDGRWPGAGLVQGSDSNFYGTTFAGGMSTNCSDGCGTVFRVSPSGVYTTLYSFAGYPSDGSQPAAGLVQGSDGNFYGTTKTGGTNVCDCGTVFQISPSGSYTTLYSFAGIPTDGGQPAAGLVQGTDGNFYGTTSEGGTNTNDGTVFRISPSGSYTNLHLFVGTRTEGSVPVAGLVQGSDGNFYGTTAGGGANNGGTVFEISPSGGFATLYSFGGHASDGSGPQAGLVLSSDGNFYGATSFGGVSANCNPGCGTVFELALGGGACAYALNATSVSLPAKGGTNTVSVTAKNPTCAWTAVSNDDFITITAGASGIGNSKVEYSVPGNTNTVALTGTMTIAGQTFTVNQAAGGCAFSISPKAGQFKATGGQSSVNVKASLGDCAWTAASNDSFITITAGTNGVGSGAVSYSVAANTNTAALTGSITVAGQTFTITQTGAK
jgi:uncharacterized repeat protein (TIGR03803 family)